MTKKKTAPADKKKKVKKHKIAKPVRVNFYTKPKPEFVRTLDEVVEKQTNDKVQEGVTRPGPTKQDPGAGDNLGRLDPSKAPQALAPVLKIPFSIWAGVSEIPEMKLSDDEAEEWAVPIVALLEYYFPGKIPEIAWIWLMFLSATEKVIDSRVKIRYEKRQERERSHSVSVPRESVVPPQPAPAPKHNGAEPAESYPNESS
ncbi:hypothetical protein ES705_15396 [subsurface metagenome]